MSKRKYGDSDFPTQKKKKMQKRPSYGQNQYYGKPSKIEKKAFDIGVATYNANSTGSFTALAVPVLGSDFTNRIGRKICLKSMYLRGNVCLENAHDGDVNVATNSQMARMIIFVDLQPTPATALVATDLLVSAHPASQLNLNNRDRFRIICDKQWCFDPYWTSNVASTAYAGFNSTMKPIKKFKKLNIETVFNGTNGGTIADINSGALYMFWIGETGAGANDVNAILSTRVRYTDI